MGSQPHIGSGMDLPPDAVSFVEGGPISATGRPPRNWSRRRLRNGLGDWLGGHLWRGWRYLEQAANHALLRVGQSKKDFGGHDAISGLSQLEFERIAGAKEFLLRRKFRIGFPAFEHPGGGGRCHVLRYGP